MWVRSLELNKRLTCKVVLDVSRHFKTEVKFYRVWRDAVGIEPPAEWKCFCPYGMGSNVLR